jgi:hypothetical protein
MFEGVKHLTCQVTPLVDHENGKILEHFIRTYGLHDGYAPKAQEFPVSVAVQAVSIRRKDKLVPDHLFPDMGSVHGARIDVDQVKRDLVEGFLAGSRQGDVCEDLVDPRSCRVSDPPE